MSGIKITLRRGTIMQTEFNSVMRLADELRVGEKHLKIAADIIGHPGARGNLGPLQRLVDAVLKGGSFLPLLEGKALQHHVRRMAVEHLLIGYSMKNLNYTRVSLRTYAERQIRELEKDLHGMLDAEKEIAPIRELLTSDCISTFEKAEAERREAKLRAEGEITGIILSELPNLVIVRDYLTDATIDGYANLEP